jgi:ATP-dependent Clp protease protease subunit
LLAEHTGRTFEQVRADTDRALVLTGHDAVDYGIADNVLRNDGSGGEHAEPVAALRPGV